MRETYECHSGAAFGAAPHTASARACAAATGEPGPTVLSGAAAPPAAAAAACAAASDAWLRCAASLT